MLIAESTNPHGMAEIRRMFLELMSNKIFATIPIIIKQSYAKLSEQEIQIHASTDAGALFLDGFGDGLWLDTKGQISEKAINALSFGILQATRTCESSTPPISTATMTLNAGTRTSLNNFFSSNYIQGPGSYVIRMMNDGGNFIGGPGTAVPEPSAALLGLLGAGFVLRRKR